MERVCFRMFIKLDRVDEYEAEHQQVWPEVLDALQKSGWHNYSIFLNKKDGCLITYCEFEDFKKSLYSIAREEISLKYSTILACHFRLISSRAIESKDFLKSSNSQYVIKHPSFLFRNIE